jgi:hypothetical protein
MNSTFEFHEMELRMPSTLRKDFAFLIGKATQACWIAHSILLIDMCTRR